VRNPPPAHAVICCHTSMRNPFGHAINNVIRDLREIKWESPYIHSVISFIAICLVLLILFILYPTVGVIIQVAGVLIGVIEAEYERMKDAPESQQVGYAVSIGLLTLVALPIIVLALPFYGLGEAARWLLIKWRE